MELKVFGDYASQPSRAVIAFCKINNIPFTFIETRVGKREHLSEEYKKINPNRMVPAITEINTKTGEQWNLFESHAILRYLATTRNVPDHWYPKDIVTRAKVDQYLDWHHTFLRQGVGMQIYKKLFSPMIYGTKPNEEELKFYAIYMNRSFDIMERWLSENTYLCSNEITIADLSAACELIQGKFIEIDLKKWPLVSAWLEKVIFGVPEIAEVTKPMLKLAQISIKKRNSAKETPKL